MRFQTPPSFIVFFFFFLGMVLCNPCFVLFLRLVAVDHIIVTSFFFLFEPFWLQSKLTNHVRTCMCTLHGIVVFFSSCDCAGLLKCIYQRLENSFHVGNSVVYTAEKTFLFLCLICDCT